MTPRPRAIRLDRRAQAMLDEALDPYELTPALRSAVERHLSAYATVERFTARDVARWQSNDRRLIATARRLLALIDRHSVRDFLEAQDAGEAESGLQRALAARLAEWEARQTRAGAPHRPRLWHRRILVWRVMAALDAAGVPASGHVDAARVRALRAVLQLADALDGCRASKGSLRLIRDVWRHWQQRSTWTPRHVLFLRYERPLLWPPADSR